jgi:hypothetical protein
VRFWDGNYMISYGHTSNRRTFLDTTSFRQSGIPTSSLAFPFAPRFLKPGSDFDEVLYYPVKKSEAIPVIGLGSL